MPSTAPHRAATPSPAPGVTRLGDAEVNFYLLADPSGLVLVDGGLPGHLPPLRSYLEGAGHSLGDIRAVADRGLLFTGDALVTYDGSTGYHGPTVPSRAFTHDSRAALASLTTLDTIDATLLLPGHGEPFAGTPADADAQARSAGLR